MTFPIGLLSSSWLLILSILASVSSISCVNSSFLFRARRTPSSSGESQQDVKKYIRSAGSSTSLRFAPSGKSMKNLSANCLLSTLCREHPYAPSSTAMFCIPFVLMNWGSFSTSTVSSRVPISASPFSSLSLVISYSAVSSVNSTSRGNASLAPLSAQLGGIAVPGILPTETRSSAWVPSSRPISVFAAGKAWRTRNRCSSIEHRANWFVIIPLRS
mmetsp:Transcript_31687/g.75627  ORF Transcript_31687/g.75627 Transcript_31687/m.75627 type:complete len:216 (+) Transcript_31687:573-1220(+)